MSSKKSSKRIIDESIEAAKIAAQADFIEDKLEDELENKEELVERLEIIREQSAAQESKIKQLQAQRMYDERRQLELESKQPILRVERKSTVADLKSAQKELNREKAKIRKVVEQKILAKPDGQYVEQITKVYKQDPEKRKYLAEKRAHNKADRVKSMYALFGSIKGMKRAIGQISQQFITTKKVRVSKKAIDLLWARHQGKLTIDQLTKICSLACKIVIAANLTTILDRHMLTAIDEVLNTIPVGSK
jgi:hypothetical protein